MPPQRTSLIIASGSAALLTLLVLGLRDSEKMPADSAVVSTNQPNPTTRADRRPPPDQTDQQNQAKKIAAVKNYYRRELVKADLAIEQKRYGAHYWDTEIGAKHLLELNADRIARFHELNAEMHGVLHALSPDDPGAQAELTPLFGPESAGPNVTFLSPASREKIESLISEQASAGPVDPATLLADARDALSAEEFAEYEKWNSPGSALLRNQLVGYRASEAEFNAIAQWSDFVNQNTTKTDEGARAALNLEQQIGSERFAELMRLRSPDMQTAVHDLHRLGLPLDYAEWLNDFRADGIKQIQAIWQDPTATTAAKTARVSQLQQAYRTSLLATLSPSGATFDETELLP